MYSRNFHGLEGLGFRVAVVVGGDDDGYYHDDDDDATFNAHVAKVRVGR